MAEGMLRIALFVESRPHSGGGFEGALSTTELLFRRTLAPHDVVVFTPFEETRKSLAAAGINAVRFRQRGFRVLDRLSSTLMGNALFRRMRRLGFGRLGRHLDALLDDHNIDLAMFSEIGDSVLRIGDHPFIATVWDTDHRDWPEFPEKFSDRMVERMDRALTSILPRAMAVIVNSDSGAKRLADLYSIDASRLIVLPFVPSLVIKRFLAGESMPSPDDVRNKYNLPANYVFYPVYLLPLKNHLYLLEGLVALEKQHGISLHAVFTGCEQLPGYEATIRRQVEVLGLTGRVHFLGLVPAEEMPALYQAARAMVMPTYSGPTNLPPLEAVSLGCPVVYADIPGCREQMGDAALYCDLNDPESLADNLVRILTDSSTQIQLREAGKRLAAELADADYGARLAPALDAFAYLKRRWAWPA